MAESNIELLEWAVDLLGPIADEIVRVSKLLASRQFLDAIPGHLNPDEASQARIPLVLDRLQKIAAVV